MKKTLSKIVLATLVISSMPVFASLGQHVQNGIGTALLTIGNNSGRIAATASALSAILVLKRIYNQCKHCDKIITGIKSKKEKKETDQKTILWYENDKKGILRITPVIMGIVSSLTAFLSYGLSRTCGWAGSQIKIVSMPADACQSQSMQNTTRTMLQDMGNNSGWLAFAALLPCVYAYAREKEDSKHVESKDIIKGMAKIVVPVAGVAVLLSKACSWAGSKI